VAYGLKFAGALCGSKLVKADLTAQIQTTGVEGTAYAARLPGNTTTVMILNKDAVRDQELTFDFAEANSRTVETETPHAPEMDAREAHFALEPRHGALKLGRSAVMVPHASGRRGTVR